VRFISLAHGTSERMVVVSKAISLKTPAWGILSAMGIFATTIRYHESLCKIDHFPSADCRIIDNHEGQEAY
jgi:hypothetical protein